MKAFRLSQFGYCPLIWLLCTRHLSNCLNSIRKRALRIVYNNMPSSFEELLDKGSSVLTHAWNI